VAPIIAFPPFLMAIKAYGAKAGAFILGSRVAQIVVVITVSAMLYQCKVGGLESDLEDAERARAVAESNLAECQAASRTQQDTIRRLEMAESENAERYLAEVRRSERQAERINELEQEQQGRNRDEVREAIDAGSGDQCGSAPMPDDLRLRLRP